MVLDRGSLKRESKVLLKTAQVSPYLFTLVLLAIMFVINGISDYVQMDDEFAYVYSLRFDMDLSFIGWNILVGLTLGILDIWVAPYIAQSNIAFFQEIKKIKGVGFFPPRPEDDDQFRPHDPFGEDNW